MAVICEELQTHPSLFSLLVFSFPFLVRTLIRPPKKDNAKVLSSLCLRRGIVYTALSEGDDNCEVPNSKVVLVLGVCTWESFQFVSDHLASLSPQIWRLTGLIFLCVSNLTYTFSPTRYCPLYDNETTNNLTSSDL